MAARGNKVENYNLNQRRNPDGEIAMKVQAARKSKEEGTIGFIILLLIDALTMSSGTLYAS